MKIDNKGNDIFRDYPDVITVNELQSMLRIGRNKAYELLKTKQIRSIPNGRHYIIPKQSVIDFLTT